MSDFLKKVEGFVDKVQALVQAHTGVKLDGKSASRGQEEADNAGPGRFTLLLAALDGDTDGSRRDALAKALRATGLYTIRMLPPLFELPWATASGREAPGRVDLAMAQIERNEADALLWGRLIAGGKAMRIGVIVNGEPDAPLAYDVSDQLIPAPGGKFGGEQARLLVTSIIADTLSRGDAEMAAALNRALRVASAMIDSDENPVPEKARVYGLLVQARAHLSAWRHDSDTKHLQNALRCGGSAAAGLDQLRDETGAAWGQCLVGVALTHLAGETGDRSLIKQGIDAFEAAILVRNRKQRPLDWAYATLRLADILALDQDSAAEAEKLRDAAEEQIRAITGGRA